MTMKLAFLSFSGRQTMLSKTWLPSANHARRTQTFASIIYIAYFILQTNSGVFPKQSHFSRMKIWWHRFSSRHSPGAFLWLHPMLQLPAELGELWAIQKLLDSDIPQPACPMVFDDGNNVGQITGPPHPSIVAAQPQLGLSDFLLLPTNPLKCHSSSSSALGWSRGGGTPPTLQSIATFWNFVSYSQ